MSSVRGDFGLWLLLLAAGVLAADTGRRPPAGSVPCYRKCPAGQHCEVAPPYGAEQCVDDPTEAPTGPTERCDGEGCPAGQVCLPQPIRCIVAPCPDIRGCYEDSCLAVRCGTGTVCNTRRNPDPSCGDYPDCYFSAECVPRAEPRPGFCPPPDTVSQANVNLCEYDNDCPLDELCCPGASKGGRNCTRPLFPDPCEVTECPPAKGLVGGTCVVRDGVASCVDRVCQPGTFFCRDGFQCYCSDAGQVVCTDVPASRDCAQ